MSNKDFTRAGFALKETKPELFGFQSIRARIGAQLLKALIFSKCNLILFLKVKKFFLVEFQLQRKIPYLKYFYVAGTFEQLREMRRIKSKRLSR
jgi:hypothetical protein